MTFFAAELRMRLLSDDGSMVSEMIEVLQNEHFETKARTKIYYW